jgi:hypothetical protein
MNCAPCPGILTVAVEGVPTVSALTTALDSDRLADGVAFLVTMVYVPVTGNGPRLSMPEVATGPATTAPDGSNTNTVAFAGADVMSMLTTAPAVPEKVLPAVVIDSVAPTVIVCGGPTVRVGLR